MLGLGPAEKTARRSQLLPCSEVSRTSWLALVPVIKQRVRCTEAKLICTFWWQKTTFITPAHSRVERKRETKMEEKKKKIWEENIITLATYVNKEGSLVTVSIFNLWTITPAMHFLFPLGFKQAGQDQSHPWRSVYVFLRGSKELWNRGQMVREVPGGPPLTPQLLGDHGRPQMFTQAETQNKHMRYYCRLEFFLKVGRVGTKDKIRKCTHLNKTSR